MNNKKYLSNTISSSIIQLDKKTFNILKQTNPDLSKISKDKLNILKSNYFIVEDNDFNEVDWAQSEYLKSKYKQDSNLKIDIALTPHCNFRCPYCFESFEDDNNKVLKTITKQIRTNFSKNIKQYINFVLDKEKEINSLTIVWYGGEPMLESDLLIELNKDFLEICKKKKIQYENIIITNGYLISKEIAKKLSKQNVSYVQITLDGPKEIHNTRRTTCKKEDTFTTITNNIELFLQHKIETVIRINLDKSNYPTINKLTDFLFDKFKKNNPKAPLYITIGRLFGGSESYSLYNYEKPKRELMKKIKEYGFSSTSIISPGIGSFCGAERDVYSAVIDIFGNLYKCWNYVFIKDKWYGNISEIIKSNFRYFPYNQNSIKFIEGNSLIKTNNGKCLECNFLPFCRGLCPDIRLKISENLEENIYKRGKCKKIVEDLYIEFVQDFLENKNKTKKTCNC